MTGLLVGIAGVAALVGLDLGHINMVAVVMVLLVAVGYATGPLILDRHLSTLPSMAVVAASLAITAVIYAPVALTSRPSHVSGEVIASVITLAVVCTALAFLIFFALIAAIGPTRATVITYVNPAVAIALGVAVLGEPLTSGMLVGFPLVIVGSVLATSHRAQSPDEARAQISDSPVVTPG
jgi:drug/metabolite transporter (DMT)-like permease